MQKVLDKSIKRMDVEMNNCVSINLKKDQIVIKIAENADQKQIILSLIKKLPDLKKLYKVDNDLQAKSFVDLIKYLTNEVNLVGLNNFE